jgi:hypothetical protein
VNNRCTNLCSDYSRRRIGKFQRCTRLRHGGSDTGMQPKRCMAKKVKRKFLCYQADGLLKYDRQRDEQVPSLSPLHRSTIGGTLNEFHQDYCRTSSRRTPGVRRRLLAGKPTSAGAMRPGRVRRKSLSSCRLISSLVISRSQS